VGKQAAHAERLTGPNGAVEVAADAVQHNASHGAHGQQADQQAGTVTAVKAVHEQRPASRQGDAKRCLGSSAAVAYWTLPVANAGAEAGALDDWPWSLRQVQYGLPTGGSKSNDISAPWQS